MKRIVACILLIVFAINLGGIYYIFKAKEYAIKKEIKTKIKQGVPKEELFTFIMNEHNEHEFEWEHSKEFEYNGMMYDVVYRTTLEDGSIKLECVSDVQESTLFKQLDQYLACSVINKNHGKHPMVEFHTFLQHLSCQQYFQSWIAPAQVKKNITLPYIRIYQSPFLEIPTNPPTFC